MRERVINSSTVRFVRPDKQLQVLCCSGFGVNTEGITAHNQIPNAVLVECV